MGVATPQRGLVQRQRDDEPGADDNTSQAPLYSGIARREQRRRGRFTRGTAGRARVAPDPSELEVGFSQLRERKHESDQRAGDQDMRTGGELVPSEQVQKGGWPHAHTDSGNKVVFAATENTSNASQRTWTLSPSLAGQAYTVKGGRILVGDSVVGAA